jgi:hypothetical protein
MEMLIDLGFDKYAYDWREKHLDEMEEELKLAKDNNIQVFSVWMWINEGSDTIGQLSHLNERIFDILKNSGQRTTIWLSISKNYFEGLNHEQSLKKAADMVSFISNKSNSIGADVALYNHNGWFGEPSNQVEIIKSLPQYNLTIVYNFHHGHQHIDTFTDIVKTMKPYLSVVNLNGMREGGPKILDIGAGDHEKDMVDILINAGFKGPWGILGHIEDEDIKKVLIRNLEGLQSL